MRLTDNKGNFANIAKQKDGRFCVIFGYTVNQEDTATDRKMFATEKTAISKANNYLKINIK